MTDGLDSGERPPMQPNPSLNGAARAAVQARSSLAASAHCSLVEKEDLIVPTTLQFDAEVRRLTNEHPDARPFLCQGMPYPTDVMLVGLNPGLAVPFWRYWNAEEGCDRSGWLRAYRNARPQIGPMRRRIELLFDALSGYRCVESNLYPLPSRRLLDLPRALRSTALFDYLLETLRPRLLFVHGTEAVAHLRTLSSKHLPTDQPTSIEYKSWSGIVYATRHLSYFGSDEDIVSLGAKLRAVLASSE